MTIHNATDTSFTFIYVPHTRGTWMDMTNKSRNKIRIRSETF